MCVPIRQEFILLSNILGVSAVVYALNNPRVGTVADRSVLGPFFMDNSRSESRSRRKRTMGSTCVSRVVCSHRGASPIRAQSLRRGSRGSGRQGLLGHSSHWTALHRTADQAEDRRTIEGRYKYQDIVPVAYLHPWRCPFSVFIFLLL